MTDTPASPMTDTPDSLVARAILMLAGVCDGASTQDGTGFNRMDAEFGHSLAWQIQHGRILSEKQFAAAKKLCVKYQRQLVEAGFDMDAVKAEAQAAPPPVDNSAPQTMVVVGVRERETDKALLLRVVVNDTAHKEWLPKSRTTILGADGDTLAVEIPTWLLCEKPALKQVAQPR